MTISITTVIDAFPELPANTSLCIDPPDSILQQILSDAIQNHSLLSSYEEIMPYDCFWQSFRLHRNPEAAFCPEEPKEGLGDPLRERSTCPFVFEVWSNSRMYPDKIREATCVCSSCLDSSFNNSSSINQCEALTVNEIRLWKTGEADTANVCEWRGFKYPRAVGCTCARPEIGRLEEEDTEYEPVFG